MINIRIDVHKLRCVATLKKDSKKRLEQITFDNTSKGIIDFINHIKNNYKVDMRAV